MYINWHIFIKIFSSRDKSDRKSSDSERLTPPKMASHLGVEKTILKPQKRFSKTRKMLLFIFALCFNDYFDAKLVHNYCQNMLNFVVT